MKRAKTPFLRALQRAFAVAQKAKLTGKPVEEIIEEEKAHFISRRDFIKQGALASMALGTSSLFDVMDHKDSKSLRTDVKIGIIGGGIAGLNAAYTLKKAGFSSQVFEATNRAGGRMFSKTDLLAPGLVTELGGEFIDSDHDDLIGLANEFGFTLLDRIASETDSNYISEAYYFNNQSYSLHDLAIQAAHYLGHLNADVNSLPDLLSYHHPSQSAVHFDNMSISDYLDYREYTGWFRKFIESSYVAEYGLEANQQSSINYLFLVSTSLNGGKFYVYGTSDERYKVSGGNQQIPLRLSTLVPNFNTGSSLKSIKKNHNGYTLGFNQGPDRNFDYVILAIPFTILRTIDIQVPLPPVKFKSIHELGYGTNAKLMAGFTGRRWNELGYGGYSFTDLPFLEGWDNSEVQAGHNGGYTFYLSGNEGLNANQGSLQQKTQQYLNQLDKIFPGAKSQYNGKSSLMHWPSYNYTLGSYACYKPGQWTTIGGAEIEPVGNIYFAGEHCSYDFQGYMNGGAETGRRAAESIIAAIG